MERIRLNLREYYEGLDSSAKSNPTKTDYVCECPECVKEGKTGHYCWITKDFRVGHCFRCDTVFVNKEEQASELERTTRIKPFKPFKSNFIDYPEIDTTYYYESKPIDEVTEKYLLNRNPFIDYNKFQLKCRYNRVVIPFYYGDALVYYQIRFIDPTGPKYFNPVTSNKPLYMVPGQEITDTAVLSEGTFDVMALDSLYGKEYTKIGLLGKFITDSQLKLLKKYDFKHFLVYLDETELSIKLAQKVSSEFPNAKVNAVKTELDPEEYLRTFKHD